MPTLLAREQRSMAAILERPEVLAVGVLVDPKKVAHRAAAQAATAREAEAIKTEVRKAASSKDVWASFVESIKC